MDVVKKSNIVEMGGSVDVRHLKERERSSLFVFQKKTSSI